MNRTLITFILFLSASPSAISQADNFSPVQYKSEFEENVFNNLKDTDAVDLLLAITEEMNPEKAKEIKLTISNFKSELNKRNFQSKKEEKKLKLLFDLTHKSFFEKYEEVSNFNRIFEVKEYNCVSATALYTLILNEYKIPFNIKEAPSHVYSIAYPDSKGIVLESTAPKNGYYSPSTNDIQKAVSSLIELKYITQNEVDVKGVRKVYNDFFYNEENIDFQKLAGLQYYNESLKYFRGENYKQALNSAYKACILYPSDKTKYLKFVLLANVLSKTEFEAYDDIRLLTEYANLSKGDNGEIVNSYNLIINNRLFAESNMQYTDSAYNYLNQNLADPQLSNTISEIHFFSYGKFYFQISDFNKSLEFASKAFNINDKNVNTQALITQSIIQKLAMSTGSISSVTKMDEYEAKFPFLKDNNLYQSLYFFNYASVAYNYLRADDLTNGLRYLMLMESIKEKFGDELRINENQYGMVYAEAGALYYREKQYKEAKKIIKKGLEIMPDHPELKIRLEIVMEELE